MYHLPMPVLRGKQQSNITPYLYRIAVTSGVIQPTRHHIHRHAIVPLKFFCQGEPVPLHRNIR